MEVRLNWLVMYLFATAFSFVLSNFATAQSVAIQVPGGRSNSISVRNSAWPPNSMSAEMRRWDAILDQSYPSWLNGQLTGRELVRQLNRLGLPTILTQSAQYDMVPKDEVFGSLPLTDSSLRTRLIAGLSEYNAMICFGQNRIGIVSLDDAHLDDYFMTVSYDVTALVSSDPYDLIDTIQESVDGDSWMDSGQGVGTIVHNEVNGRDLLTISQTYQNQRSVQQLLGGFNRLSGASRSQSRSRAVSYGSRAIRLPTRRVEYGNAYGGGMFCVPDRW